MDLLSRCRRHSCHTWAAGRGLALRALDPKGTLLALGQVNAALLGDL